MPDNENQAYINKRKEKLYEEIKTHLMYYVGTGSHADLHHPAPG